MAMLRYQHVAKDSETQLGTKIAERLGELQFEPVRVEGAAAAINIRGQEVSMIQTVIVPLPHGASLD